MAPARSRRRDDTPLRRAVNIETVMAKTAAKAKTVYPECVRHLGRQRDVKLRHFFLCDECAALWTKDAFENAASLYNGEILDGYCLVCNKIKRVRLRTWPLCDGCFRVAIAIGRNHEAEEAIERFWEEEIQPYLPNAELVRNDLSALRPQRRRPKGEKKPDSPIDFLVRERTSKKVLFGIENKTGPSAVPEMSRFQLDTSDCDDILNEIAKYKAPAYIVHAQVLQVWDGPTTGHKMEGFWWTDPYRMGENFENVFPRSDEKRLAANYSRNAFHEISTLAAEITNSDGHALLQRYETEGPPTMYDLTVRKKKKARKKKKKTKKARKRKAPKKKPKKKVAKMANKAPKTARR